MKRIFLLACCLISVSYSLGCASDGSPRIIENSAYILYIPEGAGTEKRPLVVALSPAADAESILRPWRRVADKYKWIILASKQHRNGLDFKVIGNMLSNTIRSAVSRYPVDERKIIATGFSGGGMSSHYLSMAYPSLICAVVINTAMINEAYAGGKSYMYPGGKRAVFLASPTDFRYNEMKRDASFLKNNGWKTYWIEFSGGHSIAPESAYLEAAEWLENEIK